MARYVYAHLVVAANVWAVSQIVLADHDQVLVCYSLPYHGRSSENDHCYFLNIGCLCLSVSLNFSVASRASNWLVAYWSCLTIPYIVRDMLFSKKKLHLQMCKWESQNVVLCVQSTIKKTALCCAEVTCFVHHRSRVQFHGSKVLRIRHLTYIPSDHCLYVHFYREPG